MKKTVFTILVFLFVSLFFYPSTMFAEKCAMINDGMIMAPDGSIIGAPVNERGYKYIANKFKGDRCAADYDNPANCTESGTILFAHLEMKWSEEALASKDCDTDGVLDQPVDWIGSEAQIENFFFLYFDDDSTLRVWYHIVAVPIGASLIGGQWQWLDKKEQLVVGTPVANYDGLAIISTKFEFDGGVSIPPLPDPVIPE